MFKTRSSFLAFCGGFSVQQLETVCSHSQACCASTSKRSRPSLEFNKIWIFHKKCCLHEVGEMDGLPFKGEIWAIPAATQGLPFLRAVRQPPLCLFIFGLSTVVKVNSEATSEPGHTSSPNHIYKWSGPLPFPVKTKISLTSEVQGSD